MKHNWNYLHSQDCEKQLPTKHKKKIVGLFHRNKVIRNFLKLPDTIRIKYGTLFLYYLKSILKFYIEIKKHDTI